MKKKKNITDIIGTGSPGEGFPYKRDGGARRKFCKDPVSWVWLENRSLPRDTTSYIIHYMLSPEFFFRLNTAKAPAVETPKRYDEQPRHFYMGVSPP